MQLEVLEKCIRDGGMLAEIISLNPCIKKIYKTLRERPERLIAHNKKAVMKNYGLKAKSLHLKNIVRTGNALYRERLKAKKADNIFLIEQCLEPENAYLLL